MGQMHLIFLTVLRKVYEQHTILLPFQFHPWSFSALSGPFLLRRIKWFQGQHELSNCHLKTSTGAISHLLTRLLLLMAFLHSACGVLKTENMSFNWIFSFATTGFFSRDHNILFGTRRTLPVKENKNYISNPTESIKLLKLVSYLFPANLQTSELTCSESTDFKTRLLTSQSSSG